MKEETDGASRLEAKIDILIRLSALALIADVPSLKDRSVKLSRAGLTPKEIAVLCDSTPNAVSVALSAAKKDARA